MIALALLRGGVALIDDEDREQAAHSWRVSTRGYVVRGAHPTIVLSRVLLGLAPGDPREADHVNGDKLDNTRSNLRALTAAGNMQNVTAHVGARSPHRGVAWHKRSGRWQASARLNGHKHWLGLHDTEEQAAEAAAAFRREHMPFSTERTR